MFRRVENVNKCTVIVEEWWSCQSWYTNHLNDDCPGGKGGHRDNPGSTQLPSDRSWSAIRCTQVICLSAECRYISI